MSHYRYNGESYSCRETVTYDIKDEEATDFTLGLYPNATNLDKFVKFVKDYFSIPISADDRRIFVEDSLLYDGSALLYLMSGWSYKQYTTLEECIESCWNFYSGSTCFYSFLYIMLRNDPKLMKLFTCKIHDGPASCMDYGLKRLMNTDKELYDYIINKGKELAKYFKLPYYMNDLKYQASYDSNLNLMFKENK